MYLDLSRAGERGGAIPVALVNVAPLVERLVDPLLFTWHELDAAAAAAAATTGTTTPPVLRFVDEATRMAPAASLFHGMPYDLQSMSGGDMDELVRWAREQERRE